MQKRLEAIESKYDELTQELSRPEIASDPSRLRQLGRQHAELQDIVTTYRSYRDALRQAEEARALSRDERDREMAEYFRTEATAAEATAANLERKKQIADDSAKLLKLASDLKSEVDKTSKDTLSLGVIRKAEEIEKLAHNVKEKMKLTMGGN